MMRTSTRQGVIKWKAHAMTVAAAALIVPSLCGVYFWRAGQEEGEAYWIWASIAVWRIHAAVAVIALLFWVFEKPRAVAYVRDDAVGWARFVRANPRTFLIFSSAISLLLLGLAIWKAELAFEYWRWDRTGRAFGHAWSALLFLGSAALAGFAPALVAFKAVRRWIRRSRKG